MNSELFGKQFVQITNDMFNDTSFKYRLEKVIGFGSYGVVTKCHNKETGETVAMKMISPECKSYAKHEVKALKKIRELGSENHNITKFYESFTYQGIHCLVFEMLDINLEDYAYDVVGGGLDLCDIRVITEQILIALNFLKGVGRVHRDIKPDNIMLVNRKTLQLKLIDFGFLTETEDLKNEDVAPICYRPPEEMLYKPENSDMWSVGCTLAFLFLGEHLFPNFQSERKMLLTIAKLLGATDSINHEKQHPKDVKDPCSSMRIKSLDELLTIRPQAQDRNERLDLEQFVDLLKKMLVVNPRERITSSRALNHSFITMNHLYVGASNNSYVQKAFEKMTFYKRQEQTSSNLNKTTTSDTTSSKTFVIQSCVDIDSWKHNTSSSEDIFPLSTCGFASPSASPDNLNSKTPAPKGEFNVCMEGRKPDLHKVGRDEGGAATKSTDVADFCKQTEIDNLNHKEVKTENNSTVLFPPNPTIKSKQSPPKADVRDQPEEKQTSSKNSSTGISSRNSRDVKMKNISKVICFNSFNTFILDHINTPTASSRLIIDEQYKPDKPLTKAIENPGQVPGQGEKTSKTCQNPSHLVEVKTRKKHWKRVNNFFSNINCFGLSKPTTK